jgi:hypothetical protein
VSDKQTTRFNAVRNLFTIGFIYVRTFAISIGGNRAVGFILSPLPPEPGSVIASLPNA